MNGQLKVLVIEDTTADYLLLERFLQQKMPRAACFRVISNEALDAALRRPWDVVLSDYNVPGMDFAETLRKISDLDCDLPVIMVSGTIGEEKAIELFRLGLADFVLKDSLARLPSVIDRALNDIRQNQARRAAEAALADSELQFRSLFQNSRDAVLLGDAEGRTIRANAAAQQLFGYTEQELRAIGQSAIVDQSDPRYLQSPEHRSETGNSSAEYTMIASQGRKFEAEVTVSRYTDINGKSWKSLIVRDLTERKKQEAERHLLSEALRQSAQPLMLVTPDRHIMYVNTAFTRLLGYSDDDIRGKPVDVLVPADLAGREIFRQAGQHVREQGAYNFETNRLALDGEEIPVVINLGAIRSEAGELTAIVSSFTDMRATRAREALLRKLSLALEQSTNSIIILDLTHHIDYVNEAFVRKTGYSREEVLGRFPDFLHSAPIPAEISTPFREALAKGEVWRGEFIHRRKDGTEYPESIIVSPLRQPDGKITHYVSVEEDITERKAAYLELEKFRAIVESSDDAIIGKTLDGTITSWNPGAEKIFGYSAEEIVGKSMRILIPPERQYEEEDILHRIAAGERIDHLETVRRRKDGEIINISATISPIHDHDGNIVGISKTARDISEQKRSEARINHLAFYDTLTQLPNRRLFLDRLRQAVTLRSRGRREGGLLLIDLDNFKSLNENLGHPKGDELLIAVAATLQKFVREGDTVARVGGDEFVIIQEDLDEFSGDTAERVRDLGEVLIAAIGRIRLDGAPAYVPSASIGAVLLGDSTRDIDELMKQMDIAMYQAKAAGRRSFRFFNHDLQAAVRAKAELEDDLRRGIHEAQLELYYQPQVDGDGRWYGAEALVRWNHPHRGLVSPGEFIPLAEESGLILALGKWVLETACQQLAAWSQNPLMVDLELAVNISAKQLRQAGFVDQVMAISTSAGINPRRLKLELTESSVAENIGEIIEKMFSLKNSGLDIALDDFGTGYSSLSYLKNLPIYQLKIDQSFVRDVLTNPSSAHIAKAIVALARSFGLSVIAEGVETKEQQDFLATSGCNLYQGYYFSRPLPLREFEARRI